MRIKRWFLLKAVPVFIVLISFLTAFPAWAQGGYGGWHNGPGMMWGAGSGWFGGISMFIFWGLIIFVIILAARWLTRSTGDRRDSPVPESARPLEILKERYARGEITREEYQNMRKDLEG